MAIVEYAHTRELLMDHLKVRSETYRASLMNQNYVFDANHRSFTQVIGISAVDVSVVLYSSAEDRYRLYVQSMLFSSVTGDVGGIVIYRDGFANNIDRPMLFYVDVADATLSSSEYSLVWDKPLMEW